MDPTSFVSHLDGLKKVSLMDFTDVQQAVWLEFKPSSSKAHIAYDDFKDKVTKSSPNDRFGSENTYTFSAKKEDGQPIISVYQILELLAKHNSDPTLPQITVPVEVFHLKNEINLDKNIKPYKYFL